MLYYLETWEAKDGRDGGRRIAEALLSTIGQLLFLSLLVDYNYQTGLVSSVLHWYGVWTLLDSFFLPFQVRLIITDAIFNVQHLS